MSPGREISCYNPAPCHGQDSQYSQLPVPLESCRPSSDKSTIGRKDFREKLAVPNNEQKKTPPSRPPKSSQTDDSTDFTAEALEDGYTLNVLAEAFGDVDDIR